MAGKRQIKKNLKKAEAKLSEMLPVVKTRKTQKTEKRKTNMKIVGGVAAGAALGAAAGLLFAPKSGKETRADIKKKTTEAVEVAKKKSTEVVETVKEKLHVEKSEKKAPKPKATPKSE